MTYIYDICIYIYIYYIYVYIKKTIICIDHKTYQSKSLISLQGLFQALGVWAYFLGRIFEKREFRLLSPLIQMSFLTIFNENIFFIRIIPHLLLVIAHVVYTRIIYWFSSF